jgi:hypothetical protein
VRSIDNKKQFSLDEDDVSIEKKTAPEHLHSPKETKIDLIVEKKTAPEMTVEHVEKIELRDDYDEGAIDIGQPTTD